LSFLFVLYYFINHATQLRLPAAFLQSAVFSDSVASHQDFISTALSSPTSAGILFCSNQNTLFASFEAFKNTYNVKFFNDLVVGHSGSMSTVTAE
jgi:hypothetical protein